MRRKTDTLLWGCWIFGKKTMIRVKQLCPWLEWRVWDFNNSEKLRFISVSCWTSTVNFRHSNSSCKILGKHHRVRHWQKQAKPPNKHICWFKIPRSSNVGGFNLAEKHHYWEFYLTLKMQTTFFALSGLMRAGEGVFEQEFKCFLCSTRWRQFLQSTSGNSQQKEQHSSHFSFQLSFGENF